MKCRKIIILEDIESVFNNIFKLSSKFDKRGINEYNDKRYHIENANKRNLEPVAL